MIKNIVKLDAVIKGKTYSFISDEQPNTEEIKEALFQFSKYIGFIEDQAKAQKEAETATAQGIQEPDKPVEDSNV